MPTYEYVCRACGHDFERFQQMSDEPEDTCPECGKKAVDRLISAGGGLVFKGSGFYATDYRKDGPPKGEREGSSASESSDKADSAGSKAKDGAASDSKSGASE